MKEITLKEAEKMGYGKSSTLRRAIFDKRLKSIKKGSNHLVTIKQLESAGYTSILKLTDKQKMNIEKYLK